MKLVGIFSIFIIIISIIDFIFFVLNTHPWSVKTSAKLIVPIITSSLLMLAWGTSIFVFDILQVSTLCFFLYSFALILRVVEFKTYYDIQKEEPKNIRIHVSELQKNSSQTDLNKKAKF